MKLSIGGFKRFGVLAYAESLQMRGGNFLSAYVLRGEGLDDAILKFKEMGWLYSEDDLGVGVRIPEDYWGAEHSDVFPPAWAVNDHHDDNYRLWVNRRTRFDEPGGKACRIFPKSVY